jgi:hypothetical protein
MPTIKIVGEEFVEILEDLAVSSNTRLVIMVSGGAAIASYDGMNIANGGPGVLYPPGSVNILNDVDAADRIWVRASKYGSTTLVINTREIGI